MRLRPRSKTGRAVLIMGLLALFVFGLPWVVMLLLGAAHSQDARIPAFGYWATFWLTMAIEVATHQASRD
jgi:hypothetical protein